MRHATTTISTRLADVLTSLAATMAKQVPRAMAGEMDAVHRARVTSRRVREILPLLAHVVPADAVDRARRDVQRVTRALGAVREADVTLDVLHDQAAREGWAPVVVSRLARRLEATRDRQRDHMTSKLTRVDVADLARRIADMAAMVSERAAASWTPAMLDRIRRRARTLSAVVRGVGALYVPARLHAVRIATKKLRYSLEAGHEAAGLPCERAIGDLRDVQELLGRLHDLQMLEAAVQAISVEPGASRGTQARHLRSMLVACERECRTLHAEFLAVAPGVIVTCSRAASLHLPARKRMLKASVETSGRSAVPPRRRARG
jgi:CHAD domain-containing protein